MTDQLIRPELMQEIFSERTLLATGPFAALSIGILLLITAEVVPGMRALRKLIFVATIGVAGWYAWRTMSAGEMWVFDKTYVANSTTAWWTMLFLASTL